MSAADSNFTQTARRAATGALLKWILTGWAGVVLLVLAVVLGIAMAVGGALGIGGTGAGGNGAPPSKKATQLIPAAVLGIDQSKFVHDQCPGLSWTVVAAIIHLESGDGSNVGPSSAGARGYSQFEPRTWDYRGRLVVNVRKPFGKVPDGLGYAIDGDGDGKANIDNPMDSIPATARLLCANGGGDLATLPQAIYAYNHAWWYVYGGNGFQGILPLAAELDGTGEATTTVGGTYLNPLGGQGDTKGCPFEGSHLHPYNNWQSDNALDIYTPMGTTVFAVDDGVISSRIGAFSSSDPHLQGLRVTVMANGNDFYYAHLSKVVVVAGQQVTRGQVIGFSGKANGVAHLHFAMHAPYNVARAIGLPPDVCPDSNWVWPPWLPLDATAENGSPLQSS